MVSSDTNDSTIAATAQSASTTAAAIRTQVLIELLERIDVLCTHLALTIERSIMNLPNSSLWGKVEQNKLLKLLITLEEFDMAVEGFANSKIRAMQSALTRVDVTDDTWLFASDLSASFFGFLSEACTSFRELFDSHYDKPETLNLLLCWIQKQVIRSLFILMIMCWNSIHGSSSDTSMIMIIIIIVVKCYCSVGVSICCSALSTGTIISLLY